MAGFRQRRIGRHGLPHIYDEYMSRHGPLQLFNPISIEAIPDLEWMGDAQTETYPKSCTIKYEFGPRGDLAPCALHWYDGGRRPPEELFLGEKPTASGSLVIGEKGRIYSTDDYHNVFQILPTAEFMDYKKPGYVASPGHFTEFANAIRDGRPELAMSNFEYASGAGDGNSPARKRRVAQRQEDRMERDRHEGDQPPNREPVPRSRLSQRLGGVVRIV